MLFPWAETYRVSRIPELIMEVAEWWIKTHELDHFEKAVKIRDMIGSGV